MISKTSAERLTQHKTASVNKKGDQLSFEIKLQECMLNLMMYREMCEWNKGAEVGDTIEVDSSSLQSCKNDRINLLLLLEKAMDLRINRISNRITIENNNLDRIKT
jgi:hypothetical protein